MKSGSIPGPFIKYFWDCDFHKLNLREHDFFIIERILNFGNMDSIKWLFSTFDRAKINAVVAKSRNLNKKTVNYWRTVFDDSISAS